MGTAHTNTDAMRQLSQLFLQLNNQITKQIEPQIQKYVAQLEGEWQGVSRQRFEQMLKEWHTAADHCVTVGEEVGRYLQTTSQQFKTADPHPGR